MLLRFSTKQIAAMSGM
ncbi:unnamed protein product [Acanthoscelides obtectus]|uniref:Uncharacterized protein n=1 Tax=Acanthoscelides obtectus TaxID=200917 RepID=A0A9P0Q8G6_ACAOB|nr:unnamed protein product [Acanthoscelides obtectus]CAK1630339.1 hypothetical protein AOBTE_LOCUS6269 [Acanthoscelides obtectus]